MPLFGDSTRASRRDGWLRWGFDYDDVHILHHTFKALKVRDSRGRVFWVPFSAVHEESEVPKVQHGMLIVRLWFAQREGWVDRNYLTVWRDKQ